MWRMGGRWRMPVYRRPWRGCRGSGTVREREERLPHRNGEDAEKIAYAEKAAILIKDANNDKNKGAATGKGARQEAPWAECFAAHIAGYIGQTVTVFTACGGMSGAGFTGVPLAANRAYVRMLVWHGRAPFYPPSTVYIRTDKIVCFRHALFRPRPTAPL